MSRFEGAFTASGEAALSAEELVALLEEQAGLTPAQRQQAIACYLSGGDGWRDAREALGGAFAREAAARIRLSDGKAE